MVGSDLLFFLLIVEHNLLSFQAQSLGKALN